MTVAKSQQISRLGGGSLVDAITLGQFAERLLLIACAEQRALKEQLSRGRLSQLLVLAQLEVFRARGGRQVPLNQICKALGLPRSTVHAQLRDAVARGWVRHAEETYSLTIQGKRIALAVDKALALADNEFTPLVTVKAAENIAQLVRAFIAEPEATFSRGFSSAKWVTFRNEATRRNKR